MKNFRGWIAAALLLFGVASNASTLVFDTGSAGYGTTNRLADSGVGQSVLVSTSATIVEFAFFMDLPVGGQAKFMIWDGSSPTLLFSTTRTLTGQGMGWVSSGPMSFLLNAGSRYEFGVIANNRLSYGYLASAPSAQNGIAIDGNNTNYRSFANPVKDLRGGVYGTLRLYTAGGTSVPEPGTLMLFALGLAGLGAGHRRRTR